MTSNVREFALALDQWIGKQVPDVARAAHRKIVLDAHRKLVMKSPVDTGRFRGNWLSRYSHARLEEAERRIEVLAEGGELSPAPPSLAAVGEDEGRGPDAEQTKKGRRA